MPEYYDKSDLLEVNSENFSEITDRFEDACHRYNGRFTQEEGPYGESASCKWEHKLVTIREKSGGSRTPVVQVHDGRADTDKQIISETLYRDPHVQFNPNDALHMIHIKSERGGLDAYTTIKAI